jgi:hypothetical protein
MRHEYATVVRAGFVTAPPSPPSARLTSLARTGYGATSADVGLDAARLVNRFDPR